MKDRVLKRLAQVAGSQKASIYLTVDVEAGTAAPEPAHARC